MIERKVAERRGGLGRGLAALIPTGPPPTERAACRRRPRPRRCARPAGPHRHPVRRAPPGPAPLTPDVPRETTPRAAYYRDIDVDAIEPNPQQPRTVFDEEALAELEHSIREFGLLQPVVVREAGAGRYQLVMGERRWRASQRAGSRAHPGDRAADGRRHPAARRAAGEHPPGPAQPVGGGRRLRATAGRVRRDARRTRRPARTQPSGGHEHHPAAQAAGDRAAPGRGRSALGRTRSRAPRPGRRGAAGRPRDADRRGRAVRAGDRRGGARWRGARSRPLRARHAGSRRRIRRRTSWPSACPTRSTPGSGWRWVSARAGSWWSSGRRTTWSGSPASWAARSAESRCRTTGPVFHVEHRPCFT